MAQITLITGGVRCGKSSWALQQANLHDSSNKIFIATAEAFDNEMQIRIEKHQNERGEDWQTIEEPLNLTRVLGSLVSDSVAVLDCLTVWLGSVMYRLGTDALEKESEGLQAALIDYQANRSGSLYIVTNEVGWGIVPADQSTRAFRDAAGILNQRIAAVSDRVVLMISGIPQLIKDTQ